MTDAAITQLARALGTLARRRRATIATAESCTGGGVAEAITRIAGSSAWFDRAFVTYSNDAKRQMLGVRAATLARHGAVSEAVAREMARAALRKSAATLAVAVTGIAGPGGGSREKPVGLVWLAWTTRDGQQHTLCARLRGGRAGVRRRSVILALEGLVETLR